jgi:hypothetical protein
MARAPAHRSSHLHALVARAIACAALLSTAQQAAHAQAGAGGYVPLEADFLLYGRPAEGLLVLSSGYRNAELVDADAVVFMGAGEDDTSGDVLTVSVGLREPHGLGQARFGRFIFSTGAIRPVHMDGVRALARAPSGSTLEVFGGMPVAPELGPRAFDWLAGARAGQWLLDERLGFGASYMQRREHGALDDEEIGTDLTALPLPWLTLNGIASWDLVYEGLAEARLSAAASEGDSFVQLLASHRVAARMLPATSLFSIVSSAPSTELALDGTTRVFPRLDAGGALALEALESDYGYRTALRSVLHLADPGAGGGQISCEASRRALGGEGWTAGTVSTRMPVARRVHAHASVEIVLADHPRGRGHVWPWSRIGATFELTPAWQLAAAVGAKASPETTHEVQGLLRVSYAEALEP